MYIYRLPVSQCTIEMKVYNENCKHDHIITVDPYTVFDNSQPPVMQAVYIIIFKILNFHCIFKETHISPAIIF